MDTELIAWLAAVAFAACGCYWIGRATGVERGKAEVIGWIRTERENEWQRKLRNVVRAQEGSRPEPRPMMSSMDADRDLVRNATEEEWAAALETFEREKIDQ